MQNRTQEKTRADSEAWDIRTRGGAEKSILAGKAVLSGDFCMASVLLQEVRHEVLEGGWSLWSSPKSTAAWNHVTDENLKGLCQITRDCCEVFHSLP